MNKHATRADETNETTLPPTAAEAAVEKQLAKAFESCRERVNIAFARAKVSYSGIECPEIGLKISAEMDRLDTLWIECRTDPSKVQEFIIGLRQWERLYYDLIDALPRCEE